MGVVPVCLAAGERLSNLTPESRICIFGLDRLSPARPDLIVQVAEPDGRIVVPLNARADIRSANQLEPLAAGAMFARLANEFGVVPAVGSGRR